MTHEDKPIGKRQRDACVDAGIWPMANAKRGKRNVQWEQAEQEALFVVADTREWGGDLVHYPNERPNKREAWKLARLGVRAGMPDNWLYRPSATQGFCFAVSELKKPGAPPSSVTEAQREWLDRLVVCGACVGVHRGWQSALDFFDRYMAGEGEHGERWWVK